MKQFLRFILAAGLLGSAAVPAYAQCDPTLLPDSLQLAFNGGVNCSTIHDSTLYVGGSFTAIGKRTGSFTNIDTATGDPRGYAAWPQVTGTVNCSVADGAGGVYIGGSFSQAGGSTCSGLAHITAAGTVATWAATVTGIVYTMDLYGGRLYVGGLFSNINGSARADLAAFDVSTGALAAWAPSANGAVYSLKATGSRIYAGGAFTTINSATQKYMAALDGSGSVIGWNPDPNNAVRCMVQIGANLYIGGNFTQLANSTVSRPYLAAVDTATGAATTWNPTPNSNVFAMLASGTGTMYIGGAFTYFGVSGVPRACLAEVYLATGTLTAFNFRCNGSTGNVVNTLAYDGNRLYAGGKFNCIDSVNRYNLARINITSGLQDTLWSAGTEQPVNALTLTNGGLYAGGSFTYGCMKTRNHSAAISMSTGRVTNWNPDVYLNHVPTNSTYTTDFGSVTDILVDTNAVYIVGGHIMVNVNQGKWTGLRKVSKTTGAPDPAFSNTMQSFSFGLPCISTAVLDSNKIFITGQIASGVPGCLQAVDKNTGSPTGSISLLGGYGYSLLIDQDKIYIGGSFRDSYSDTNMAVFNKNSLVHIAWNLNTDYSAWVNCIRKAGNDSLYIGGTFNNISGHYMPYLAKVSAAGNGSSAAVSNWNAFPNSTVTRVFPFQNQLYTAGIFTAIGANAAQTPKAAILDASSANGGTWAPSPPAGDVYTYSFYGDKLFVGGSYNTISGQSSFPFFTIYKNNTVPPSVSITASVAATDSVCAGTAVTFTASSQFAVSGYQWVKNGVNTGTNSNTYTYVPVSGDSVYVQIQAAGSSCFAGSGAIKSNVWHPRVKVPVVPAITLSASPMICAGTTAYFTAATNVAGATCKWYVNGSLMTATGSTGYSYTPANGDIVKCTVLTPAGGCYTADTVMSAPLPVTVHPYTAPTVTIQGPATACAGQPFTIHVTGSSLATNAVYSWYYYWFNFSSTIPTTGDSISITPATAGGNTLVYAISVTVDTTYPSGGCFSASYATSNQIGVTITDPVAPTASVAATPGNSVCSGTPVSFHATSNVSGAAYQWTTNSANSGTGSNLSYTPANGDHVKCVVTAPAGSCYTAASAASNQITMSVSQPVLPTVAVSAPAYAPVGSTVTATATVANAGSGYSINWMRNGTVFATTATPSASYTKGTGTDTITARVTNAAGCYDTAYSNQQLVAVGATGISEASTVPFTLYPNPFEDALQLTDLHQDGYISLYDMTGRKVSADRPVRRGVSNYELRPGAIAAGTYLLCITDSNGIVTGRTVVRKK